MVQETKSRRTLKDVPETAEGETATPPTGGRKFREVESRFVILSDKDEKNHQKSVEGALIEVSHQSFRDPDGGKDQIVGRYKLQDDDGVQWAVLGSKTLDDRLGFRLEADDNGNNIATVTAVAMGSYVRLTYLGTIRSGNKREVKQYKVEVAE